MKAASYWSWTSWWIGCFAFCASGCQLLFGDYKIDPGASGSAGSKSHTAGGSSAVATQCESNGTYRCREAVLEICEAHKWTENRDCGTATQCDAERGDCRTCEPNAWQCSAYKLQQCLPSGDGWLEQGRCLKAERCNATTHLCDPCGTDEAVCDGQYLKLCNATHSDWNLVDCGNPKLCNTVSRDCRSCRAGDHQCNQATLQRCNERQEWVAEEECASGELCQASLLAKAEQSTSWNGKCTSPICATGTYQCNPSNGAELQVCPPSRDRWERVQTCYTAELCNASAGRCDDGCLPGTVRCNGAELAQCTTDGKQFQRVQLCGSASQCNAEKQLCYPCNEGEYGCNGAVLQRCTADKQWDTVKACTTAELCSARVEQAACREPGCPKAGAYNCSGKVLQYCPDSLLDWQPALTCETEGLCDKDRGACIPPVCPLAGEFRCTGPVRERCNDQRTQWEPVQTCIAGQICTPDKGCLGECPTPALQCNGNLVQQCYVETATQTPKWMTSQTCATAALCDKSTHSCIEPTCDVNQYQCTGQQLQKCNANRNNWDSAKTCAASEKCDAAGMRCDICDANAYSCSGTTLLRCGPAGQAWLTSSSNCVRCATSVDTKTGYCYRCNDGDRQCSGQDQIQACAVDGLSWSPATGCAEGYGCQTVGGRKDFCAQCPVANREDCTADKQGLHTCATNRSAWSATTACKYGCVDNATTNDVCDTACPKSTTKCVDVGGSTTGLNTCAADGSGWLGVKQACADTGNLKLCVNGAFSAAQVAACAVSTPICAGNQCVECNATSPECAESNTVSQSCVSGEWVSTQCAGTCDPASGLCVECLPSATPTCVEGARRYCGTDNKWHTESCAGACLSGRCVDCLDFPWECKNEKTLQRCYENAIEEQACTGNKVCSGTSCVECTKNTDCPGARPVCLSNQCVECAVAADCNAPKPVCSGNKCVQCVDKADCASLPTTPFCAASLVCVACLKDADCDPDATCQSNSCVPNPPDPDAGTGTGGLAGTGTGG